MAILIDFRRIREDAREVEYTFGYPTMDRRLVIDKSTLTGRPLTGPEDSSFAKVFVKILRYHQNRGQFPVKGSYAA